METLKYWINGYLVLIIKDHIYHVDKRVWYQWFPYADWIPVNECDVPKEYLSRIKVIQLLT